MHYNAEDTAILYYIEAHKKRTGAKRKQKTESHRKPTDVPEMSYGDRETRGEFDILTGMSALSFREQR